MNLIARLPAVDDGLVAELAFAAADILRVRGGHGGGHHGDNRHVALGGRELIDGVAGQPRGSRHGLHVDKGTLAGDDYRLLDRADSHLGVDGDGEACRQVDAFPLISAEPHQNEGDRVGAGSQVDDPVLALLVADHRAGLFDEDRAGGLDRYAGQHRAGGVPHDADDHTGILSGGRGRQQHCTKKQRRASIDESTDSHAPSRSSE